MEKERKENIDENDDVAIVLPKAQNISTHYTSDVTPDYLDIMSLFSSFMYFVHVCYSFVNIVKTSVLTRK